MKPQLPPLLPGRSLVSVGRKNRPPAFTTKEKSQQPPFITSNTQYTQQLPLSWQGERMGWGQRGEMSGIKDHLTGKSVYNVPGRLLLITCPTWPKQVEMNRRAGWPAASSQGKVKAGTETAPGGQGSFCVLAAVGQSSKTTLTFGLDLCMWSDP